MVVFHLPKNCCLPFTTKIEVVFHLQSNLQKNRSSSIFRLTGAVEKHFDTFTGGWVAGSRVIIKLNSAELSLATD
jgi:hypothetical protein